MRTFFLFVSFIFFACIPAQADITLLGGVTMPSSTLTSAAPEITTSTSIQNDLALGILISQSFTPLFAIETGGIYFKQRFAQSFTISSTTTSADYTAKRIQIPLVFMVKFIPFVNAGAGLYYENGLGDLDASLGGVSGTATYSDANLKKDQYGLVFDLRFKMPFTPLIGLVADARYQLGLGDRNKDTSVISFKTNSLMILGGLNIGF